MTGKLEHFVWNSFKEINRIRCSNKDHSPFVAQALEEGVRVLLYVGDMASTRSVASTGAILTFKLRTGFATGSVTWHGPWK